MPSDSVERARKWRHSRESIEERTFWTDESVAAYASSIWEEAAQKSDSMAINTKPENCDRCDMRGRLFRCSYHEGWDDAATELAAALRARK